MKILQILKIAIYERDKSMYKDARKRHGIDGLINILHRYLREPEVKIGEVVAVKGNERNQVQWKLRIITEVYPRTDGKMRAVRLRAGKLYLERAIQHLYSLGLSYDMKAPTQEHTMDAEAKEFRPRRNANEMARVRINDLANDDREGPFNEKYLIADD